MSDNKKYQQFTFGWKRDLPDQRDKLFSVSNKTLQNLPPEVDLRPGFSASYDQGRIGSCTANAIAAAVQYARQKAGQQPDFTPSRLFIYYNERVMEETVLFDGGAFIRSGVKSVNKQGVCSDVMWSYDDTPPECRGCPFPVGSKPVTSPTQTCYDEAMHFQSVSYERVGQTLSQLRGTLAEGFPIIFGFTVYSSFYDENDNPRVEIPLPGQSDGFVGGHAVLAVGYRDDKRMFIVRNSWGENAQDGGYFYMPYSYVSSSQLAADFWVIKTIEA